MAFVPPKYTETAWSENAEVNKMKSLSNKEHSSRRLAAKEKIFLFKQVNRKNCFFSDKKNIKNWFGFLLEKFYPSFEFREIKILKIIK